MQEFATYMDKNRGYPFKRIFSKQRAERLQTTVTQPKIAVFKTFVTRDENI